MILSIQKGTTNPILRQKAAAVEQINAQIKELVLNMIETLKANNGVGLAAPQIGKSLQIIIIQPDPSEPELILINPQIKKVSRKQDILEEGCLSLPNLDIPVRRPIKITVKALNLNGQKIKIRAKDLLARVIQHEIDHLNGILISDK
mgnify:CR=1 FL=1|tara:strand:+ start:1362 stop:1802 length:441 start_codon:yes stop_codon:yes gene_type:complete